MHVCPCGQAGGLREQGEKPRVYVRTKSKKKGEKKEKNLKSCARRWALRPGIFMCMSLVAVHVLLFCAEKSRLKISCLAWWVQASPGW